jgi:hypothetical protein
MIIACDEYQIAREILVSHARALGSEAEADRDGEPSGLVGIQVTHDRNSFGTFWFVKKYERG